MNQHLTTPAMFELQSTITCPECGHTETETMPTDACQFFYDCKGCGELLKPLDGSNKKTEKFEKRACKKET